MALSNVLGVSVVKPVYPLQNVEKSCGRQHKLCVMASISSGNVALEAPPQVFENTEYAHQSKKGGTNVVIRRVQPEDAVAMARSCYDSFLVSNQSLGIPPHLDYPNFENTLESMMLLSSTPEVYGVVAVDESSGTTMAGGFLTPGDIYGVDHVFTDNAFKGRGAAKAVMRSLLERAKADNAKSIRLNQTAANVKSFGLYTSLGFIPAECWMDMEGSVTTEQASSASHSVGYHPLIGAHVRRMEDADVKFCNELHVKVNGLGREQEIRPASTDSWVVIQDRKLIAYTTGFNLMGHAVAEREEALVFLFTKVCLHQPVTGPLPTLHVLGRLYPRLLQWALAAKLKVRRNCWLMVMGSYQPPQHGMVYCPSITA